MAIANGGQVVVSETVESLVRGALPPNVGLLDLGEHRLRDLARPIGVFQVTHPALPRDLPPLRSLDVLPGNLPVQVTSFVGREQDLERVATTLGESRVVTLTGVGGVGKTRLALQVAAEILPAYRDGAWLCELAGVRDPDAMPEAVAAMFGLQPPAGLTVRETLLEFLVAKELLLVFDNCEHLLSAVAELVGEVVRAGPGVRVLATSREGLNTAGEHILVVSSLDVPKAGAGLDVVGQCDAVRLFVERARAVKSDFALDDTNASAVTQLCRRLDGVALAIELAAARVGMLTPIELARRLDQRFRLLAGGARGTVERHQTLRAALDWSYQLLGEAEQRLLGRLSVFAGGFSLEAAEAVTVGEGIEAAQVFDLLAGLVARSLVEAVTEGTETRYRLLETIRQYAQEHLDEHGETERLRTAHAAYYARSAEEAVPNLLGPDGLEWERRLTRELDNLRAALTWAIDTQDADTALCLLDMYDARVTDVSVAFSTEAEAAVTIPGASEHPRFPGVLVGAALAAHQRGDQDLAEHFCEEALAAEQRLATEARAGVWLVRAQIALSQGRAQQTVEYAGHGVALCRARGDMTRLAWTLSMSATGRALTGDLEGAIPETEEAIALTRRYVTNPLARSGFLGLAAFVLADVQPEHALTLMREAIELGAPLGTRSQVWGMAGDLAVRLGNQYEALEYFTKAIDGLHRHHARTVLGSVLGRVADLLADEDPEAAAILLGANDAFAPDFALAQHVIEARERSSTMLETTLGETARDQLRAQGLAMDEDDAVTYAHAAIKKVLDRSTETS
jgi:predicted ATPase